MTCFCKKYDKIKMQLTVQLGENLHSRILVEAEKDIIAEAKGVALVCLSLTKLKALRMQS